MLLWFEPVCFLQLISLHVNKREGKLGWLQIINTRLIKSRVIKHFSIVGLTSPGWVRTHSDFCWTRGLGLGLGLGPNGLGLWSNGLGLGLGLWSSGLGLTPDGLGLWPDGLGLGLGLWPCGLGLTAGLTSLDSLQHWLWCIQTIPVHLSTLAMLIFATTLMFNSALQIYVCLLNT